MNYLLRLDHDSCLKFNGSIGSEVRLILINILITNQPEVKHSHYRNSDLKVNNALKFLFWRVQSKKMRNQEPPPLHAKISTLRKKIVSCCSPNTQLLQQSLKTIPSLSTYLLSIWKWPVRTIMCNEITRNLTKEDNAVTVV